VSLTIGRLGVSTANGGDGRTLEEPFAWSANGRDVTIQGIHKAANDADATWFHESIAALDPSMSPDEPDIPVTSSTVSTLNGYYSVTSASSRIPPGSQGTGHLLVEWQVSMRRGRDWRQPRVEQTTTIAGIVQSGGASTADAMLTLPGDASQLSLGYSTRYTRTAESGTAELGYSAGQTVSAFYQTYRKGWNVAPGSFYKSGAYIVDTGKTYGTTIGRRDFDDVTAPRIGNGLVRCSVDSSNPSRFTVANWNGSTWNSGRAFTFYNLGNSTQFHATSATVIRNGPAECALRFSGRFITGTTVYAGVNVDVCVGRGDRLVRFYTSADLLTDWQIRCVTTTACTAVTGGLRSTSTISSEYQVMLSDYTPSTDTTNGRIPDVAAVPALKRYYAVGWTSGGSTSSTPDGAAPLVLQGFFTTTNALRVVTG
jgi:hypothetical protein